MQPVVVLTWAGMQEMHDIIIIIGLAWIMIILRQGIEQTMLMRYYRFYKENYVSLHQPWIDHFEESIQKSYAKINKYTPRDWEMYI
jgi:hypothetical protein